MAYEEQLYIKILNEYETIRAVSKIDREKRIQNVYQKIPRIREIDHEINLRGMENMNHIFRNPSAKDQYNAEFKKELAKLNDEKTALISRFEIDPDYEKIQYNCELCEDTGYIGSKKCRCFEQKLINASYSKSNIEKMLREQNFSTFSFQYFSEFQAEKEMISPLENIRLIHKKCVSFCQEFDRTEKSLLFHGTTGSGKTFLSSCIAKELIEAGKTVIYTRATRLFTLYEDYLFGRASGGTVKSQLDRVFDVDLLIIDDLGTEKQNKNTLPFLFDILNTRMADGKKMIISTNFNMSELTKVYSARFTSRIYEYFLPLRFFGDDIRIQKMKEAEF